MRIPSIQLKAAALVPMPRVRQRIAKMEKPGLRRSIRKPKPRSWKNVSIGWLLSTKSIDRIQLHRRARGQVTCKQPNQRHKNRHNDERSSGGGAQTEKQTNGE